MSQSALVQSFDVYAVGTVVLELIVGKNPGVIAQAHMQALARTGKVAAGPYRLEDRKKVGQKTLANKYGVDNALHDWVKTCITDEADLLTIVRTLRKVGDFPDLEPRPTGEGQQAWNKSVGTWKEWARLLKGLLEPTSRTRWTACFALAYMEESGSRSRSSASPGNAGRSPASRKG